MAQSIAEDTAAAISTDTGGQNDAGVVTLHSKPSKHDASACVLGAVFTGAARHCSPERAAAGLWGERVSRPVTLRRKHQREAGGQQRGACGVQQVKIRRSAGSESESEVVRDSTASDPLATRSLEPNLCPGDCLIITDALKRENQKETPRAGAEERRRFPKSLPNGDSADSRTAGRDSVTSPAVP